MITDNSKLGVVAVAVTAAALLLPATAAASPAGVGGSVAPPLWRDFYSHGPAGSSLVSITAPAKNAAWAVGQIYKRGQTPTGYMLRWNGQSWRERPVPVPGFVPSLIRSSSPTDVWMFGFVSSSGVGEALHWNGLRWLTVTEPTALAGIDVGAALVLGPDNVWARDYHWNGRTWTHRPLPSGVEVTAIVGVPGRNNVWAAGVKSATSQPIAAFRLVNGSWQRPRMPHPKGFVAFAVAESADSVFITAAQQSATTVLHWNGRSWRTLPAPPMPENIYPVAAYGRDGLWVSSDMLWTGKAWFSVLGPGDQVVVSGSDMAAIPRTNSTWMVGGWCAGALGCRNPVQVMVRGSYPG